MKIEVSNGEILDKLTILEIKLERILDQDKLINIKKEYDTLSPIAGDIIDLEHELVVKLKAVNSDLWVIEDDIRELERREDFGKDFIALARMVYKENDSRAKIKKDINKLTGSNLSEEKSYKDY